MAPRTPGATGAARHRALLRRAGCIHDRSITGPLACPRLPLLTFRGVVGTEDHFRANEQLMLKQPEDIVGRGGLAGAGNGKHFASQPERANVWHDLSTIFGSENVFLASRSILPGEQFDARLLRAVWRSDALVAVIGRRWLNFKKARGKRALDDPEDWTRREIVEAFSHQVTVIPLLVGDIPRLAVHDLPVALADLARVQSIKFDHRNPEVGLGQLRDRLAQLDGTPEPAARPAEGTPVGYGGIGSITGTNVNAVIGTNGPVNAGNGTQVNYPTLGNTTRPINDDGSPSRLDNS